MQIYKLKKNHINVLHDFVYDLKEKKKLPIIANLELLEFTRLNCVVQEKRTQTFSKLCNAQICDLK